MIPPPPQSKLKYLVFLHIEKTAGTAFRRKLYETYGIDNVFWYHIDSENWAFDHAELLNYQPRIIGGHRQFSFYPQDIAKFYFMAVLRDPVERTLSAYHYFRSRVISNPTSPWITQYQFDPNSLINTLKNCPIFIDKISNRQCQYLSGHASSEQTLQTIKQYPFLIGTHDNISKFLAFTATLFNWPTDAMAPLNCSTPKHQKKSKLDKETLEIIRNLNAEDIIVYQSIKKQNIYFNPEKWQNIDIFKRTNTAKTVSFPTYTSSEIILQHLKLDHITVSRSQKTTISNIIRIRNRGDQILHSTKESPHILIHQLYKDEKKYGHQDTRSIVTQAITSGTSIDIKFNLSIPHKPGDYTVAVSLYLDSLAFNLDHNYHQHCCYFRLTVLK